jgi:hypothetical protein
MPQIMQYLQSNQKADVSSSKITVIKNFFTESFKERQLKRERNIERKGEKEK